MESCTVDGVELFMYMKAQIDLTRRMWMAFETFPSDCPQRDGMIYLTWYI